MPTCNSKPVLSSPEPFHSPPFRGSTIEHFNRGSLIRAFLSRAITPLLTRCAVCTALIVYKYTAFI